VISKSADVETHLIGSQTKSSFIGALENVKESDMNIGVCAYRNYVDTMTFSSTQLLAILGQILHADLDKGESRWSGHIVGYL